MPRKPSIANATPRKPRRVLADTPVPPPSDGSEESIERDMVADGFKPAPVQHSDHLVAMEKLVAEVTALRAAVAEGFDKLVAAVLDAAVEEAATPGPIISEDTLTPPAEPPPADPVTKDAPDASKKKLAPPKAKATLDDVREALNAYTRVHGLSEASKVVQGLGVKRLTELPPERYAEAVAALKE